MQGDQYIVALYYNFQSNCPWGLQEQVTAREPNNNIIIMCKAVGQFQTFVEQMCLVTEKIWPFKFMYQGWNERLFFSFERSCVLLQGSPSLGVLEKFLNSIHPCEVHRFLDKVLKFFSNIKSVGLKKSFFCVCRLEYFFLFCRTNSSYKSHYFCQTKQKCGQI